MPQNNVKSVYLVIQLVKLQVFLQMRALEGPISRTGVVLCFKNGIGATLKFHRLLNFCPSCNILGLRKC